jgi:hypothetical protein
VSGTTAPPAPATPSSEPVWAKPSIGIYALTLFVLALGVAVYAKNENGIALMIGAIISNATTVIGYYFGSSSGSTKKTDLMAANPAPVPLPLPTEPAMVTRTTSTSQTTTPIPTPAPTPIP